jgi:(2Fe-2S) ferredoxin
MAGAARTCWRVCKSLLGPHVRVLAAPCVGRCETAPVAVVHQHPVLQATPAAVQAVVQSDVHTDTVRATSRLQDYSRRRRL